jgi:hypothetical protein
MPAAQYAGFFHVDHILARQHGGETDLSNLALACMHCNRRKGPNIAGSDSENAEIVRLFDPRGISGQITLKWYGSDLIGRTSIGRVTIHVLAINEPDFRAARAALRNEAVAEWD